LIHLFHSELFKPESLKKDNHTWDLRTYAAKSSIMNVIVKILIL